MKYFQQQRGMTLIEIMISLLIGAFLIGGIIQIFVNTKQTYRMQENLSRMQENGRFAMEFLTKDIRIAGYQGCANLSSITPNVIVQVASPNPNPLPSSLTGGVGKAVSGTNNVAIDWDASACGASDACIANTDVLTIHTSGPCGGTLTGNMGVVNANIQIDAINTCDIEAYDILMLADCSSVDIFVATSSSLGSGKETIAHASNQNSSNNLSKTYGTDAEILKYSSFSYFIRTGASGAPSLWRLNTAQNTGGTNPVELIEGIENMQTLYGEDVTNDQSVDYYVSANQVVNMENVISLKITLLVQSMVDNLTSEPRAYTYNGTTITPTDNRLRRVFSSTIAVRNRLP